MHVTIWHTSCHQKLCPPPTPACGTLALMSHGEGVLTSPLASHLRKRGKKPGFSEGDLRRTPGTSEPEQSEKGVTGLVQEFYKPKRKWVQQKRNFLQPHACLAWCLGLIWTSLHGTAVRCHSWAIFPSSRVAVVAFVLKLNYVFFQLRSRTWFPSQCLIASFVFVMTDGSMCGASWPQPSVIPNWKR